MAHDVTTALVAGSPEGLATLPKVQSAAWAKVKKVCDTKGEALDLSPKAISARHAALVALAPEVAATVSERSDEQMTEGSDLIARGEALRAEGAAYFSHTARMVAAYYGVSRGPKRAGSNGFSYAGVGEALFGSKSDATRKRVERYLDFMATSADVLAAKPEGKGTPRLTDAEAAVIRATVSRGTEAIDALVAHAVESGGDVTGAERPERSGEGSKSGFDRACRALDTASTLISDGFANLTDAERVTLADKIGALAKMVKGTAAKAA